MLSVGREVKEGGAGLVRLCSLLPVRLRLASPLSMCREGVKACKENDMSIFVFEERNSGSSMGVRQRAEMDTGRPAGGSFQNR